MKLTNSAVFHFGTDLISDNKNEKSFLSKFFTFDRSSKEEKEFSAKEQGSMNGFIDLKMELDISVEELKELYTEYKENRDHETKSFIEFVSGIKRGFKTAIEFIRSGSAKENLSDIKDFIIEVNKADDEIKKANFKSTMDRRKFEKEESDKFEEFVNEQSEKKAKKEKPKKKESSLDEQIAELNKDFD